MALYQNGILISGANTLPQMTLAEYQALPVSERPTYWERTDLNYNNIPASDVTYGSGSVEDALDALNAGWTFLDSVSVTGGTGSTNSKAVTLPSNAKEYLLQSFVGDALTGTANMPNTQTDVNTSVMVISSSGAITTNYGGHFNRSTSTLEAIITYRSGGNLTVGARLYYR